MTAYRISEVSAGSPDMDAKAFAAFVADIRERGQLVPIVVRDGEVIDGRKRLLACEQIGIKPKTIMLTNGASPEVVARSLNELRTHYTRSQLGMIQARRANHKPGRPKTDKLHPKSELSQAQAAKEVGVGVALVSRARAVLRDASPEVIQAVDSGELTIAEALRIAKDTPKDKQHKKLTRRLPVGHNRSPRQAPDVRVERSVDSLEVAVEAIQQVWDRADRHRWTPPLKSVRLSISRLLKQRSP